MTTLIGYVRASTRKQAEDGHSLAMQRNAISAYAAANNIIVIWREEAQSGKSMRNRPVLQEALAMIRRGEAEGVIAYSASRLSRSVVDFATLLEAAQKEGWRLIALDLQVDLGTASGRLVAGILALVAQWEREVLSERTRDGLAAARAEGVRLGRPLVTTDCQASYAKMLATGGRSNRAIARELNVAHSTVARLLRSSAISQRSS